MFIICRDEILRTLINLIKENDFTLKKARNRRYPAETTIDADYADDIALLGNTHAQAKSLLYNLEHIAGGISLHVNANKTEYMCFNQEGAISTFSGEPLKLVDKFTYFGSSISSIKSDVNIRLVKA